VTEAEPLEEVTAVEEDLRLEPDLVELDPLEPVDAVVVEVVELAAVVVVTFVPELPELDDPTVEATDSTAR
jgi:hypothetical protein